MVVRMTQLTEAYSDDQRKHFDLIQAIIARLSASSAAAKGWTLTVAGAGYGFSSIQKEWYLALLATGAVVAFSTLDASYLTEERRFRCLYEAARKREVEVYSMNKDAYASRCTKLDTYFSWSVIGFYGPLVAVGYLVLLVALAQS